MNALMKVSFCLFYTSNFLEAELVVIKREGNIFVPLDVRDEVYKYKIADVLLSYQWPMVVANRSLSKSDKNELLTSHQEYAEEQYIAKKLKQINELYDLIFIPTSMYEIFILSLYQNLSPEEKSNKIHNGLATFYVDLIPLFNSTNQASAMFHKINALFDYKNKLVYPDIAIEINNLCAQLLLTTYSNFATKLTGQAISEQIKNECHEIAASFIKLGTSMHAFPGDIHNYMHDIFNNEIDRNNSHSIRAHGILAQVIALEYRARKENKGILLRGTKAMQIHFSPICQSHKKNILKADATLPENQHNSITILSSTMQENSLSRIVKASKKNKYAAYSISFGNSLFAGIYFDHTASAYHYLTQPLLYEGYALFVDKKRCMQHDDQLSDLFFISPLASFSALFAHGEWFHSRTKAAVSYQDIMKRKKKAIVGIFGKQKDRFVDLYGIITTTQDPLRHAQFFSNYLVENMEYIDTLSAKLTFSDEAQKEFLRELEHKNIHLKKNQKAAADYYASISESKNNYKI